MRRILALICLLAVPGCGRLYDVRSDCHTKLPGIPFIPVEFVETTTIADVESWTEVKATRVEEIWTTRQVGSRTVREKKGEERATYTRYVLSDACVEEARTEANNAASLAVAWSKISVKLALENNYTDNVSCPREAVLAAPPPPMDLGSLTTCDIPPDKASRIRRLAHTRTVKSGPSRTKVLYINVRRVVSGTTEGAFDLNENGMLTKATAKTTDDTFGKILDALPIQEAVSHWLELPSGETKQSATDERVVVDVGFETVPVTRVYKRSWDVVLPAVTEKIRFAPVCSVADGMSFEIVEKRSDAVKAETPPKSEAAPAPAAGTGQAAGQTGKPAAKPGT